MLDMEKLIISPLFQRSPPIKQIRQLKHDAVPLPTHPAIESAIEYFKMWLKNGEIGLLFCGIPGCKKTTALRYFYHLMVNLDIEVRYVSASELVDSCKIGINQNKSPAQIIEPFVSAGCLCIDDLGTEKISDWSFKEIIYPLINGRLVGDKIRPTLISSNLDINGLNSFYSKADPEHGARFLDRMGQSFIFLRFPDESFRKKSGMVCL